MATNDNAAIVKAFFADMQAGGLEAAGRHLAPGFVWWAAGAGEIQDQLAAIGGLLAKNMKGPMKMTVHGITAEGERVAVEAESYGELNSGAIYNNKYHFLFIVRDGKITTVKEYNDTKHAGDVLGFLFT
jgi:ketosteroid isomerase-like protein